MAIHFRSGTVFTSNEVERFDGWDEGPCSMPTGCYLGFMLGPDSDHDLIRVSTGTDSFTVGAGAVVPVERFQGQPQIETVRSFDVNLGAAPVVHVIGLTCEHELAATPRRAPVRRFYALTAGEIPGLVRIPLGGRRHAMVCLTVGQIGTLILRGVDPRYGNSAELLSVALAAGGAGVAYHVGGTDHEELWPVLEVEIQTSTTGSLVYYAAGEVGG
jgi:hypothetical protein